MKKLFPIRTNFTALRGHTKRHYSNWSIQINLSSQNWRFFRDVVVKSGSKITTAFFWRLRRRRISNCENDDEGFCPAFFEVDKIKILDASAETNFFWHKKAQIARILKVFLCHCLKTYRPDLFQIWFVFWALGSTKK